MHEKGNHVCFCPLEGVIDVISKKWALLIVNSIGNNGRLRFNSLIGELGGISPKTLSDTLKELQAEGLIKREYADLDTKASSVTAFAGILATLMAGFSEFLPQAQYTISFDWVLSVTRQ
jgi:DNA-binding Lrp family transcriptional regulator